MGAAYQKPPQHLVAFLGDTPLRIPIPRPVGGRHEPQVRSNRAALLKAVRIFQRQHKGKGSKHPYSLDLAQEVRLMRVVLFRDRL